MAYGFDGDMLNLTLETIRIFSRDKLTEQLVLELDDKDEAPEGLIREMCGDGLGIQLLFIPEEYGGMGGGAFDVYRVCETLAYIDLGIATGVLATFLGSDPINVGGTLDQKKQWLTRLAEEGLLMAYGATEPEAGSDLGALKTTATPVVEDGRVVGYRISGKKQWISNGGIADLYSILANAPGGPSWFVVERGANGFEYGKPEDKHGIRLSNTSSLSLEGVYVDSDRLLGEVEGQGLQQAQAVFGYTRLMVAAFGLGGGWAALDRAIQYSTERIQAGGPLSEKQGYTHKLIVPHAARLEAARSYVEETARRIDDDEGNLNTEGAIAKYLATEAGNLAADAAIQALGGYGYTRDFVVEKIKRDVRITTIYEGTSEIMEMTIARDRWQEHMKTRGQHYHERAGNLEALAVEHPDVGASTAALALHALAEVMERCRTQRLTRNQHVLLRLGELIAYAECAGSMACRAAAAADGNLDTKSDARFDSRTLAALSRVFARDAAMKVAEEGTRLVLGAATESDHHELREVLPAGAIHDAQKGLIADMDQIADSIYGRPSGPQGGA